MSSYSRIPPIIKDILDRYAAGQGGALTGGTRPLVENDLARAVALADAEMLAALPAVIQYMHDELPSESWGSPEAVRAWVWRGEVAAHPNLERVVRIERDPLYRLGPDTHAANRYALAYDEEGGGRREQAYFIECLGLFPTDTAAAMHADALRAGRAK
jgi:hypothetical protein